jgi:hypothetical protein
MTSWISGITVTIIFPIINCSFYNTICSFYNTCNGTDFIANWLVWFSSNLLSFLKMFVNFCRFVVKIIIFAYFRLSPFHHVFITQYFCFSLWIHFSFSYLNLGHEEYWYEVSIDIFDSLGCICYEGLKNCFFLFLVMFNCRVYFHVKIRFLNLSFDPVYV